ncbi:MAG TPA: hypothetical protein PKN09_05365 [Novosphingobium sp.]|nr:hypothetical protein [Novosphingobium sp.]
MTVPATRRDVVLRAGAIWLAVAAIFLVTKWAEIRALALPDADDTLRMIQVRDLFAGQPFWDLHQYRIDPPAGMLMHWSRLVDLPLWALQVLLRPLLGPELAEHAALVIVPLLTLGAAMLLVGRLAARIGDKGLIAFACVVLALATPVTGQMQPLRIDHHGWQIVAALAALNGLVAANARRGGWIMGLSLALGMSISLELLPIAVLLAAILTLRWLRDPAAGAGLIHFLLALATISVLAFFATHGMADLAAHCDAVSPPYLAALVIAAGGTALLGVVRPRNRWVIVSGLGAIALIAGAALLWLAPTCQAGPFTALDPLVRRFWYDNVHEGMPVWLQKPPVIAQMILPGVLGLIAAIGLARRSEGMLRQQWCEYALLLAGTILLAVLVARASAVACAFAAVPFAALLRDWQLRARAASRPLARIAILGGMAMAVMPGVPLLALGKLVSGPAKQDALPPAQLACNIPAAAPVLNRIAPATIFAPIDIGPVLLAHTHHKVVATAHHRAPQALHDLIAAFIADPDAARPFVEAHGAHYVLVCPGLIEAGNYQRTAPQGLMARLLEGKAPTWLRPVPLPQESGLSLWEVAPR